MANGIRNLAPNLWQKIRRLLEPESGAETVGLIGASMMPGVGEAIDIADIAAGIQDRDLGRIGLGAVGLALPFISGRTIRGARDLARAGDTPPGWGPKAITPPPPPPPVKGLEALDNSRLEKFFLDTQQGKATGSQWQSMLNKAPGGIPKGEMEWTGITKLLSDNPSRKFTRAELQKHMDDSGIKLRETWRSYTKTPYEGWDSARFETELSRLETEAHWQRQLGNSAEESRLWSEIDQMTRAQEELAGFGRPKTPEFGDWRIEGPSKNYRELTVQFEPKGKQELDRLMRAREDLAPEIMEPGFKPSNFRLFVHPDRRVKYDALTEQINALTPPAEFTGTHWSEPNVLVHMRMSDRVGVNPKTGKPEKVLFVEEIQSDWHQKGRDQGYFNPDPEAAAQIKAAEDAAAQIPQVEIKAAEDAVSRLEAEHGMSSFEAAKKLEQHGGRNSISPMGMRLRAIIDEFRPVESKVIDARRKLREIREQSASELRALSEGKIPQGPFKDTDEWVGLGMRRAIQEGVDGGYDRIAWGTGEQVAKMFDLRKHVSKIDYNPDTGFLEAWGLDGHRIITERNVTPEQLPEYIGKEPTERLLSGKPSGSGRYYIEESSHPATRETSYDIHDSEAGDDSLKTSTGSRADAEEYVTELNQVRTIKGEGLEVGGDDMLYFYDKIVPNAVKKEGKKLGGIKIERFGLEEPHTPPILSLEEQLRAFHEEPVVLGSRGTNQSFAITPEMRNIVGRSGQRLWGTGGLVGLGLAARQQRHRVTTNG
jgi:hypothetical protein